MPYLSPSLEEQTEQEARAGRPPLDTGALAVQLRAEYDEAERARSMVNLRWLEDLRQYRGMYAPGCARAAQENQAGQGLLPDDHG